MKIGLYDPYLDTLGGGERYMLTMASYLSQKHTVTLFWDDSSLLPLAKKRFGLSLDGVRFVKNIFSSEYSLYQRIKQTKQYDKIIYLSDGSIPFIPWRNLYLHFQHPVEWVDVSMIIKYKMSFVQGVLCNSLFTKEYIDKKFSIQSTLLYPPVTIQSKNVEKENIILHVGRLAKTRDGNLYKKQDFLIDAFQDLVNSGIQSWKLILVISVRKEDEGEVEMLRKRGRKSAIDIVVNPSGEELWSLYAKAKIYWHASGYEEDLKKHPEYAEHFGITTVEAMGSGLVPVVFNAGGQKEIVVKNKNGFTWERKEELLQKTKYLIDDTRALNELSMQAKKRAMDFSYDQFCQKLNEFL